MTITRNGAEFGSSPRRCPAKWTSPLPRGRHARLTTCRWGFRGPSTSRSLPQGLVREDGFAASIRKDAPGGRERPVPHDCLASAGIHRTRSSCDPARYIGRSLRMGAPRRPTGTSGSGTRSRGTTCRAESTSSRSTSSGRRRGKWRTWRTMTRHDATIKVVQRPTTTLVHADESLVGPAGGSRRPVLRTLLVPEGPSSYLKSIFVGRLRPKARAGSLRSARRLRSVWPR
jgi:hypothetical protein